ncbi:MAG: hypothetical protein IIT44_10210, partial [Erysipelotrichaceae bacterium]|nr:hypothetical protein [Erysipelotrichaceae bacterium]
PNGIIELMNEGDVVTHTYHGKPNVSLFKPDGTPKDGFVRARRRGVLFDVGHGLPPLCLFLDQLKQNETFSVYPFL